jgi:hypothetical protein
MVLGVLPVVGVPMPLMSLWGVSDDCVPGVSRPAFEYSLLCEAVRQVRDNPFERNIDS